MLFCPMRLRRVTTGHIFCLKFRRAATCVHSINVLKLQETRATVPKIFFTSLDAMFVDNSLCFIARDFCVDFLRLALWRDFGA